MLVTQGFESHDETDFRRLVLSLIKNSKEEHTRHTDTPTLEPDQVFCVIELYRNKRENGNRKTENAKSLRKHRGRVLCVYW